MPITDPLLKTRDVAKTLGVSVSTVKRWVDSERLVAVRTVGKHRLIRRSEALRFAGEIGLHSSKILPSQEIKNVNTQTDLEIISANLQNALLRGDKSQARSLIRETIEKTNVETLADQLVRPVCEQIGHAWMNGIVDEYQEHQATHILSALISEEIDRLPSTDPNSKLTALGATPEGDPYVIALQLGELLLRKADWNVRNLGVNLPLRSLSRAVEAYKPRLVFLSVSYITDELKFVENYRHFYMIADRVGTAVILGGRALNADLRARLVYASFGERMAHLSAFARRVAHTSSNI